MASKAAAHKLRMFSLTMIVIGLVIGLGIFRTSRDVAGAALNPSIFFAAWIAGGLLSICGGLVFAEIGSRYPVTGGYYAIFSYAYHPSIAFGINCVILVSNAASVAGVALIGSEYLLELFHPGYGSSALLAAAAIVLFYLVNIAGLQYSTGVQNFLMIIKIMVLLVIIAGIFFQPAAGVATAEAGPATAAGLASVLLSFGTALKGACFSYGGYQQTINFGGEVENPLRTIPRAIIGGMMVVITLYLLVNFAYYHIIGFEELKSTNAIATIVAGRMFGRAGEYVSALVLFLAVLAYVNVSLLSNPRVISAMSNDGILPKQFGRRHEQSGVFRVSLSVFCLICLIVLLFVDSFSKILSFSIFLDSLGMVTAGIALLIFRRRSKGDDKKEIYKIKLYPLVPLIFILGYAFVAVVITVGEPKFALTGILTLLFFLLIYRFIFGKNKTAP